jgi:DNA invertase Pin-like site-specific DNA recombinase
MTSRAQHLEHPTNQGPARALIGSKSDSTFDTQTAKRAVTYLRVSSTAQVKTDYDPEGISIPAQRDACQRKAAQMGVEIVEEYVEPGRSGRRMDQRPSFQSMLERIQQSRDIDYVIVYKLSRMNRNRVDDALVLASLRKYGVTLVSATESIDETPVGQLMHGILAAFNEFRSAEDGADIKYKMAEKARRGGTLGRAPLGYRNTRERFEGREIRMVELDPERAPFARLAFELYATGEYTLDRLVETLTERGLRTRPGRYPAGAVSRSKLQAMLRDRYYVGTITFEGIEYPGRHPALVTPELFDQVQLVLDAKQSSGERQRVHHHYLKGTVFCGPCHDEGREARMVVTRAIGRRGGEYFYFFCRARRDHACTLPFIDFENIEDAVLRHYRKVRFTAEFADRVRVGLRDTMHDQEKASRLLRQQLSAQRAKLEVEEEHLLDLAAEGSMRKDRLNARILKVQAEQARVGEQLAKCAERLDVGAAVIEAALQLLENPQDLYRECGPKERRLLNQAIFVKLYVDAHDVTEGVMAEPFAELLAAQDYIEVHGPVNHGGELGEGHALFGTKAGLLITALSGGGLNKTAMVEVMGLEPTTSTLRTFPVRSRDQRFDAKAQVKRQKR